MKASIDANVILDALLARQLWIFEAQGAISGAIFSK